MALILAIEPDRKQASKVAAIVKNRLHAEIVTADTTEHAVEGLGGRVPDLILTSLLLSPKDDAAWPTGCATATKPAPTSRRWSFPC